MGASDEYEKVLGGLEKDPFETEVCARLSRVFPDFQRIPRKPSGDGGLDGHSHAQERGYCCYGPEQVPYKTKMTGLVADILKKFRSDLRKLLELEHKGRKKILVRKDTPELAHIIVPGRKIKFIYAVVSIFESHRIAGPLNASLEEYKKVSACKYVDPLAQVVLWGPRDLATQWSVDDRDVHRLESQAVIALAKKAAAASPALPSLEEFDSKFEFLRVRDPSGTSEQLRAHYRESWAKALALDLELAATLPPLHRAIETAHSRGRIDALLKSGPGLTYQALLLEMRQLVKTHLEEVAGNQLGELIHEVADGLVGRLIGECPIDWRG